MKLLAAAAAVLIISTAVYAEDYSFDIPGKEMLELSGNLDVKYSVLSARKDSPMYQLQYYNRQLSDILSSYLMEFYLNGDYQTKDVGVHLKTHSEYYSDNQTDFNLYELYADVNLSAHSFLLMGKKMYNWGKGYAFNPVGYVNPVKDPENPELSQSGLFSINYEYSKSFQTGLVKNIALDLIVIPSANTINNKVSEIQYTDFAGKLYFLFLDADIDFVHYLSKANPEKAGIDFSRNIFTNLEMHGEFSMFRGQPKYLIADNSPETKYIDGASYLFGMRWLNEWNITTILEYYHNDAGVSVNEFKDYNRFLANAASSGNDSIVSNAISINRNNFNGANIMQDYLYLKMSWPEPFNLIYFTPAVYTIFNINDGGSIIGIPLSYKPVTNFEFLFRPVFLTGNSNSEFGSKQYKNKLEMWMRFYF
ncbi:MAG: hypothetical protein A2293_09300 [Elusimicrobia bacterium RIFOXYB2_FULL_49_7]|nr:MAG: hypothetical protein A2293_09300 [Elusimicrobia bacterium RIFOXYB2_FULL_49_7]